VDAESLKKKNNGRAWAEFIRLNIGRSGVFSEYSNEHSGSIKYGEFLD
jgi:hypothetical protein